MQVGFIGTGSMGSILLEAFIHSGALSPSQIIAYNRTRAKVESLAERHAGLLIAPSNADVARAAKLVMLCVKPLDYQEAIGQFANELTPEHILVTITSPVKLEQLESLVPCPVIRLIPSITNAALSGTTLLEFGHGVTEQLRSQILTLFSQISRPVEVEETFLRVAADLSSCGPAFVSYLLQQMIEAATKETGISEQAATYLTTQMIIGFAELVKKDLFSLQTLEQRVCVPGGITGEGLIPLKQSIPGVFNQVFMRTQQKFAQDCHEVSLHLAPK
ncbi:UNVERIFIED_CONTAM: competence protein ComER [Brevibacillus sp. OAP136]